MYVLTLTLFPSLDSTIRLYTPSGWGLLALYSISACFLKGIRKRPLSLLPGRVYRDYVAMS